MGNVIVDAVRDLVARNKKMEKQIDWFCFTASKTQCPPQKRPDCQGKGERGEHFCAICWLYASRKALEAKEEPCQK